MNNDIENLLRASTAPPMGISPEAVMAGAQRTRRRRRATISAFGLAAGLLVGVAVGANQLAHRANPVPATTSVTSAPQGDFFKNTTVGNGGDSGYIITGGPSSLQVRGGPAGSAPLAIKQELPGGIRVYQDGQHTVVVAALPAGTDTANIRFKKPDRTEGVSAQPVRVSAEVNVGLFITQKPGVVEGLIWNVGASFFSSTGERGQVASFSNAHIVWYPKLNVYLLTAHGDGYSRDSGPAPDALTYEAINGTTTHFYFAMAIPHGARDISVAPKAGTTLDKPRIQRLGTTQYDIVYVTAKASNAIPNNKISTTVGNTVVKSLTWTDTTGRHTKKY